MYLLLTDETNLRPERNAKFFAYGGLIIPLEKLSILDSKIAYIRSRAGFRPADEFKFATPTRPQYVTQEGHTEAKRQVVALCLEHECRFIVHVIHHDIIRNQDKDQQVQWAADYVIGRFNHFLREANANGICIVDNLPVRKQWKYLSEKFSQGLTLSTGTTVRLDRIKLFAATSINASHVSSAMDIVLGSFRYCINNPGNIAAARSMMEKVVRMMWYQQIGDTLYVQNRGLIIRPKKLEENYPTFKPDYDEMLNNIKGLLKKTLPEEHAAQ